MDSHQSNRMSRWRKPLAILPVAALIVAAACLTLAGRHSVASVQVPDTTDAAAPPPVVEIVSQAPKALAVSQAFSAAVYESLVYVDDEIHSVVCDGSTVLDLLLDAGIPVGGFDIISPAPYKILQPGEIITVQRVEYKQTERTYAIPFETHTIPSGGHDLGEEVVQTVGSAGERRDTLLLKYIDGECTETIVLSSRVTKTAIHEVREIGAAEAVSPMPDDMQVLFDENSNPLDYIEKLTGTAAAYSARPGAGTASGRKAVVGTVAVNPEIIPYGTKLYIKTPGGDHIYGYAVAADTGHALMRGEIIVDVFFATNKECRKFGLKTVDVYILEYPGSDKDVDEPADEPNE